MTLVDERRARKLQVNREAQARYIVRVRRKRLLAVKHAAMAKQHMTATYQKSLILGRY